jgi:drug/metabolite transporter (DMT)-like permease
LLAPLIYKDARRRIAPSTLGVGLLIFLGVMGMQYERMSHVAMDVVLLPALAVFVAACVYPLGNRKLLVHLEECGAHVSVTQRVLGMNFLSLLWYIPLGVWTWFDIAPPTPHEVLLSSGIAVCSGVIATVLFFGATEKVRRHPVGLAAVEAMQSCALLFSILVGVFIMGEAWPHGIAAVGAAAVMLGIVLFSYLSYRAKVHPA